jgi:hypothetical protein
LSREIFGPVNRALSREEDCAGGYLPGGKEERRIRRQMGPLVSDFWIIIMSIME